MLAGLKTGLVFAGLTNNFTGEVYSASAIPETQDILMQVLTSKELFQIFTSMLTVGLFLLVIFTLVKVVKVEFTTEGSQNAKGPIIKKLLRALFNMAFTPVICLFGVVLANQVLELVTTAFLGDSDDLTISGVIFTSGCYNATYSYGDIMVSLTDPVTSSITGGINAAVSLVNEGLKNIGADPINIAAFLGAEPYYLIDDRQMTNDEYRYYYKLINGGTPSKNVSSMSRAELKDAQEMVEKYKRDLLFDSYTFVTKHNDFIPYFGEAKYKSGLFYTGANAMQGYTQVKYDNLLDAQKAVNDKEKEMMNDLSVNYSDPEKVFLTVKNAQGINLSPYRVYYNTGLTSLDLCATKINYPFIIFASIILMKVMLFSSIGMVMRLYKCCIYFLILPGVIAMSPLDDGASFKKWQKKFIGAVCAAYSVVIAVNVYLSIARIFLDIKLVYKPSNMTGFSATGPAGMLAETMSLLASSELAGVILQCIFVMVGGLMIEKLCADFASLFGIDNPMNEGKGMFNKMMDPVKKVGKAVVATAVAAAIVVASIYTGGAAAGAAAAASGASAAAGGAAAAGAGASAAAAGASGAAAGSAAAAGSGAAAASTTGAAAASTTTSAAASTTANAGANATANAGTKAVSEGGKKVAEEGTKKAGDAATKADPTKTQKPDADANKLTENKTETSDPSKNDTKTEEKKPDEKQDDKKEEKKDDKQDEQQDDQSDEQEDQTDDQEDTEEESTDDASDDSDVDDEDDDDEEASGVVSQPQPTNDSPVSTVSDSDSDEDGEEGASDDASTPGGSTVSDDSGESSGTPSGQSPTKGGSGDGAQGTVVEETPAPKKGSVIKQAATKGLDLAKLAPKALERNADINARWASKLIKESLPGFGLFDSIKGDRSKTKKKLLSKDDTYKRVSENLDRVYQQRLDEKAANKHAFADQFDNRAIAKLIPEIINDGFEAYMNKLNDTAKGLGARVNAAYQEVTKAKGDQARAEAFARYQNLVAQLNRDYDEDFNITDDGKVSVKNLDKRRQVFDDVKSKLDSIMNSGSSRSEIERGLMALIADENGKGNTESIRIIEQTLTSLKDKLS